jgi:signal recognition particle GTPase
VLKYANKDLKLTIKIERLDVAGFTEPKFKTDILDSLVLQEDRKKTVKNLVKSYIRQQHAENENKKPQSIWYTDQIQGKGEGLIFLLHGKPGVGKTYTAGTHTCHHSEITANTSQNA